ncbi:nucleotidyltransferase [Metabacillus sp. 113a]|uniref:nucleotidyltransferase n=1 Tax=Metabacillus sp. 113a TaxID=3404706 RepID=UPI003CEB561A
MNILGLIVEYNPFHHGHLYHMQKSVKAAEADLTIAVMSGNFLQRGEPALLPKWERARMALEAGADLVIELPYAFASQKASTFANGAVSILDSLKANHLCFGSEDGEIEPFLLTVSAITENEDQYSSHIKEFIKQGLSYPKALSLSFSKIKDHSGPLADLTKPNNILGFQYVSSIAEQQSGMKALTIKRTSAQYHDQDLPEGKVASATSLRNAIFSGPHGLKEIRGFVPDYTFNILTQRVKEGFPFMNWERFFPYLQYTVLTMEPSELAEIYEVEEGLENRLAASIKEASTFKEFMEKLKTKRYTWTRLQRMCVHLLTRTTKEKMHRAINNERSPYIRVLGMNESGQRYLGSVKKTLSVPLISNVNAFNHPALELDIKASAVYAMGFPQSMRAQLLKTEYSTPPIRLQQQKP